VIKKNTFLMEVEIEIRAIDFISGVPGVPMGKGFIGLPGSGSKLNLGGKERWKTK